MTGRFVIYLLNKTSERVFKICHMKSKVQKLTKVKWLPWGLPSPKMDGIGAKMNFCKDLLGHNYRLLLKHGLNLDMRAASLKFQFWKILQPVSLGFSLILFLPFQKEASKHPASKHPARLSLQTSIASKHPARLWYGTVRSASKASESIFRYIFLPSQIQKLIFGGNLNGWEEGRKYRQ